MDASKRAELLAAVERQTKHRELKSTEIRQGSPYMAGTTFQHDLFDADVERLARAYLDAADARGRDDDAEPVTGDWLATLGTDDTYGMYMIGCRIKGARTFLDIGIHKDGTAVVVIRQFRDDPDDPEQVIGLADIPNATRGHVRRLLAALGLTPPPPGGATGTEGK